MPSLARYSSRTVLRLDGDAALALDVHRIEHLLDHVALRHGSGLLDEAVGERRLAVVDMGDDGEVADVVERMGGHGGGNSRARRGREPPHSSGRAHRQSFDVVLLGHAAEACRPPGRRGDPARRTAGRRNSPGSPSDREACRGLLPAHRRRAPSPDGRQAKHASVPRWIVSADRQEMSPAAGYLRTARAANAGHRSSGGNISCFQARPSSHWAPRATLERPHVGGHVDSGQVEGERGDAPVTPGFRRRRKVPVPRLVHRALERRVEADLDDPVVRPERRFAHCGDPGVRAEFPEPAEHLGRGSRRTIVGGRAQSPLPAAGWRPKRLPSCLPASPRRRCARTRPSVPRCRHGPGSHGPPGRR